MCKPEEDTVLKHVHTQGPKKNHHNGEAKVWQGRAKFGQANANKSQSRPLEVREILKALNTEVKKLRRFYRKSEFTE